MTRKGRGYPPAEQDEVDCLHTVGVIDPHTGCPRAASKPTWTSVFADEITAIGADRTDVVCLTAAMLHPAGLSGFAQSYPHRVFDVGIAEQHAITCAAGLAIGGLHPVVALYATFATRALDQLLMDVALHRLSVTVVLDRAGVTGPDGPSHHGMWDASVLPVVPGLRLAAPRDCARLREFLWECSLFEEHGFRDIKISVKHHDPLVMIAAYRQLAARCDYPLHLGVTEAGPRFQGTIKSAVAFGVLLTEGIGDTIRVSLSAPPVEEVKAGSQILESLGLRPRRLEAVSCPSCGRAQVDVYTLAEQVTAAFDGFPVPLRIAVMGCVVNGPGEAREADLGVSSGNGKGQIFARGKVIKTVPEDQIVQTLLDEALHRDWPTPPE